MRKPEHQISSYLSATLPLSGEGVGYGRHLRGVLVIAAIAKITSYAFSTRIAAKIKEKARGICQNCGKEAGQDLIAAHINHNRSAKGYNSTNNGLALCPYCEFARHAKHFFHPGRIGMSKKNNNITIKSRYWQLNEKDKEEAMREFGDVLRKLEIIKKTR